MNFKNLLQHPFAVVANFERVVALTFAFPEKNLAPFVPHGLTLDTYNKMAFLTVALVWTKHLRPEGFPSFFGRNFFLAGYRIFTRLQDSSKKTRRGLKILRSETDQRSMVILGNLLTSYNYSRIKLNLVSSENQTHIETHLASGKQMLDITWETAAADVDLPENSPFPDWATARKFAGPMPYTFSPYGFNKFMVIKGSRTNWVPQPIRVMNWNVSLFKELPLANSTPILANAFMVENISYRWSKGFFLNSEGSV